MDAAVPNKIEDEKNTIIAAQAGNDAAFDLLTKNNLAMIYRYLLRTTGDQSIAEDLAQETFVRVWKNLTRFDLKKPFRPWLFRIARNCAYDFLRKKKSIPFSFLNNIEQTHLENIAAENISPSELIEKKESVETVRILLSQLSNNEKEILTLHYLEELTVPEIAEILDKPEETVRTRLRRARQAFRQIKNDFEPPPAPSSVLKSNDQIS